jgi:hypothetical protein
MKLMESSPLYCLLCVHKILFAIACSATLSLCLDSDPKVLAYLIMRNHSRSEFEPGTVHSTMRVQTNIMTMNQVYVIEAIWTSDYGKFRSCKADKLFQLS